MKITGRDVYDITLALIAENGYPGQVPDYEERALPLINLLIMDISSRVGPKAGRGGRISSLDDEIFFGYELAGLVLPYGLAARFLLEEDGSRAEFFERSYEAKITSARRGRISPSRKVI